MLYLTHEYLYTPCFIFYKAKDQEEVQDEIMFIIRPDLEEQQITDVAQSFLSILKNNGATIIEEKKIGKKELAYEIKKQKSGFYFLYTIETTDDKSLKEFERLALINENMLRHLIVKLEK